VYIEGALRTRKWQDKSGNDRYTTEIIANEMQMLDSRGGGGMGGGGVVVTTAVGGGGGRGKQQQSPPDDFDQGGPPAGGGSDKGGGEFDDDIRSNNIFSRTEGPRYPISRAFFIPEIRGYRPGLVPGDVAIVDVVDELCGDRVVVGQ
jgi:hypothetical protein